MNLDLLTATSAVYFSLFSVPIFCGTGLLQTTSPLQWERFCCLSWQSVLWQQSSLEWVPTHHICYVSLTCIKTWLDQIKDNNTLTRNGKCQLLSQLSLIRFRRNDILFADRFPPEVLLPKDCSLLRPEIKKHQQACMHLKALVSTNKQIKNFPSWLMTIR